MNSWTRSVRHNVTLLQLLILTLLLVTVIPARAAPTITFLPEVEEKLGKGMLWKVTSPKGKVNYLFGTIHVDDSAIINLARPVSQAFKRSTSLTLELLPDKQTMLQSMQAMMFTDGRSLDKVTDRTLYKQSINALSKQGIPEPIAKQMKPWAVMMTLSVPKTKSGKFLDMRLYEKASQFGKPTYALETYNEQLSVFNGMAMDEQVNLLQKTIDDLRELPVYFSRLKRAWLARDLARLQAISDEQMPKNDPVTIKLMRRLLDDRNLKMFTRMQPRLKEGSAFIAVGALHLPGRNGLIRLLRDDGHTVEAVW